jgi:RHS repeat-associated protein
LDGRTVSLDGYRFGFQNQEKDDEIKGEGNSYDFGARILDPRIGSWFSVDVLAAEYVSISPYNFSLNNPIYFIDADGNVVVDSEGNPVTISVSKSQDGTATATFTFAENTSQEVIDRFNANGGAIINDMLITAEGQKGVEHLIKTKSKITMVLSEDIGLGTFQGEYGVIYGLTGPSEVQSAKLIKDYDGGKVYEENTIILFKGSLKYGLGDKSALENGDITIQDFETMEVTEPTSFNGEIQKPRFPDKMYKSSFQLNNLCGTHEVDHTTSANIKIQQQGGDPEEGPMQKEENSRVDPNFKNP